METTIALKDIRLYAYHGCLQEEAAIGSDYLVNLEASVNVDASFQTDALEDTVDYVYLNRVVAEEMAQRAKLLETVAYRIVRRILDEMWQVNSVSVCISKINPPIGGDVERVSVRIFEKKF